MPAFSNAQGGKDSKGLYSYCPYFVFLSINLNNMCRLVTYRVRVLQETPDWVHVCNSEGSMASAHKVKV